MKTVFLSLMMTSMVVAGAPPQPIGTYDRTALVIAYYRSSLWNDALKVKFAERDRARAAGDKLTQAWLEAWGASHQAKAMLQLVGVAPVRDIEKAIAPAFQEVRQKAGVRKIVPSNSWFLRGPTVDVTDQLVESLKPTEKTRELIRQLPRK